MLNAIVCDMDGTLLNAENQIPEKTKAELIHRQQAGTTMVLASGRSYKRLLPDADKLQMGEFGGQLIDVNGTSLYGVQSGERRMLGGMDAAKIRRMCDFFRQFNVELQFTLDAGQITYLPQNLYEMKRKIRGEMRLPDDYPWTGGMYSWLADMRDGYPEQVLLRDLDSAPSFCNKMSIVQEPDKIQFVYQSLQADPIAQEFEFVFSDPRKLEVTPKGISKGTALQRLMAEQGWSPDTVAVFGDSQNDVSMLKVVKYSVAMGNSLPVARAAANYQTADNNHEGIYQFLSQLDD